MGMEEIPVNRYGNVDVRHGVPPGCVHVPGERLTITCRANGVECAPAIVDWKEGKWGGPQLDGVVILDRDEASLREALDRRDARRLTPDQKRARREKKHEKDARVFAAEIRAEFPGMPEDDVLECADHATEIGSGRVGRSTNVDDRAYPAVVAYTRHRYTAYEDYLAYGWSREESREDVCSKTWAIVDEWRKPSVKDGSTAV